MPCLQGPSVRPSWHLLVQDDVSPKPQPLKVAVFGSFLWIHLNLRSPPGSSRAFDHPVRRPRSSRRTVVPVEAANRGTVPDERCFGRGDEQGDEQGDETGLLNSVSSSLSLSLSRSL